MIQWLESAAVYLHRQPVDFRKAINGLSMIVQEQMGLSPFDPALFVFCNKSRNQLKVCNRQSNHTYPSCTRQGNIRSMSSTLCA